MIIIAPDNTYDRGKSLNAIPYRDLSCDELSEVHAYLLAEYGPSDPRVQMPLDEFRKRDNKLERLETDVSELRSELEQLKNETIS